MTKTLKEKVLEATATIERLTGKLAVADKENERLEGKILNLKAERNAALNTAAQRDSVQEINLQLERENARLKGYIDRVLDWDKGTHKGPRLLADEYVEPPYIAAPTAPREYNF